MNRRAPQPNALRDQERMNRAGATREHTSDLSKGLRSAENQAVLSGERQVNPKQILQGFFKIAVVAFVILCLFIAGSIFLRQQDEIRRVEKRSEELQGQWAEVIRESRQIEEQFGQSRSTEEIEEIARNELGLVKPGEIIYKDPHTPQRRLPR